MRTERVRGAKYNRITRAPAVGAAGRQRNVDRVAGVDVAADAHDTHDARLANQIAARIVCQRRGHQSRGDAVELCARIAQPGDFDDGAAPMCSSVPVGNARSAMPRVVMFSPI